MYLNIIYEQYELIPIPTLNLNYNGIEMVIGNYQYNNIIYMSHYM